jgi:6-phosphogluconolactonase
MMPVAAQLPGGVSKITVLADAEAAARRAAEEIAWRVERARAEGRPFHGAFPGGTTPRRTYELLRDRVRTWHHVHLWLSDERAVPRGHPDANHRLLEEVLGPDGELGPTMHAVSSPERPEDAAWLYALELEGEIRGGILDVALLGVGDDGHTASLFPDQPALDAAEAPCVAVHGAPKPPPDRVTLTLPVLRRARYTALLAVGETKRGALSALGRPDPRWPASLLADDLDEVICDVAASPLS